MTGHRVDLAQPAIVQALRDVGAVYVDMTQVRPSVGYDGVVAFRGRLYLVEFKTPGKWRFTPRELEAQRIYGQGGVTIHVLEYCEDAFKMLELV